MTDEIVLFALNVILTVTKSILDGKNRRLFHMTLSVNQSQKKKKVSLQLWQSITKMYGLKIQTL